MGRVYQALKGPENIPIALKLIDVGTDSESQEILAAERQGAILQARLCGVDQRVTRIYEWGELDGYFYIAMEYVEGQDLSEFVSAHSIGVLFAARIAKDICEVLDHAHNFRAEIEGRSYSGIVHGDIKPRNIRMTPLGAVKVLDFGIAKALSMTRRFTSNQFASVQYSSPERLERGEVDTYSDLWSVGVVLYEMIARRPYFQAESLSKLEHLIRNYREPLPLTVDCPPAMRRILAKALAPDPLARFQTAREMADALGAFIAGRNAESFAESDATRRTVRDSETTVRSVNGSVSRVAVAAPPETEATKRSLRPAQRPVYPAPRGTVEKPKRELSPKEKLTAARWRMVKLLAAGFFTVLICYFTFNEMALGREASSLERALQTEQLKDLDAAWDRYQRIARGSWLPFTAMGARSALKTRLLSQADAVIKEYRDTDTPTVREGDWQRAQASASKALSLFPDDNSIRGRLRVAEGHLERIRGTSDRDSKLLSSAKHTLTRSVSWPRETLCVFFSRRRACGRGSRPGGPSRASKGKARTIAACRWVSRPRRSHVSGGSARVGPTGREGVPRKSGTRL
jgi:serine/threonine protein kinase